MALTLECHAPEQTEDAVQRAAEMLRAGGVVVFPTETVYGVGASAASADGMRRLREVKQRNDDKPFTVHISDPWVVERYADLDASPLLRRLVRKTMPGPVTMVIEVSEDVIERKMADLGYDADVRDRLYFRHTIGLRCPDHDVGRAVLRATGQPVVASSANPAGARPPTDADAAARAVGDQVDLILDGGPSRYARASTIITVRGGKVEVSREGVVDERYLRKLLQGNVLFVCSGNTCRSPMAEALARHELNQRLGAAGGEDQEGGVRVLSAGAFAFGGAPMTPEAAQTLRGMGIPVHDHSARPLTLAMIRQADAIYCMTETHLAAVRQMAPEARDKTFLLDPGGRGIEDPIGAGVDVYIECASRIAEMVRHRLDELGYRPTA